MANEPEKEERKIIIDEDWKSQVAREREEFEKKGAEPPPDSAGPAEIPPASFEMLVTSIGMQAMMALGQIADPHSGKAIYHPDLARHHIDTLGILQEKTSGNLSREEDATLENLLFQLRQLYVSMGASQTPTSPNPTS